jgi:hypothetical protein
MLSSVFDPLGFVGPYILVAKTILQELCRKKVEWDDALPANVLSQWLSWLKDLKKLEQFYVDRCIKPPGFGQVTSAQMHHFSDGSMTGYGVVSYLRLVDDCGHIQCSFLLSKCRLAPVKIMTIPRLELSAATLAVKVDLMIHRELSIPVTESVFWTDSMVVLQYTRNTDKRFQTFVANRIAAIHAGSTVTQWRYVEGKLNPADDASRGMTVDQLLVSKRWLQEPDFLVKDESHWPTTPIDMAGIDRLHASEIRKETHTYTQTAINSDVMTRLFNRYSSWYRLKITVAWLLLVTVGYRLHVIYRLKN